MKFTTMLYMVVLLCMATLPFVSGAEIPTLYTGSEASPADFTSEVAFYSLGDGSDDGTTWYDTADSDSSAQNLVTQNSVVVTTGTFGNGALFGDGADFLKYSGSMTELEICQGGKSCGISFIITSGPDGVGGSFGELFTVYDQSVNGYRLVDVDLYNGGADATLQSSSSGGSNFGGPADWLSGRIDTLYSVFYNASNDFVYFYRNDSLHGSVWLADFGSPIQTVMDALDLSNVASSINLGQSMGGNFVLDQFIIFDDIDGFNIVAGSAPSNPPVFSDVLNNETVLGGSSPTFTLNWTATNDALITSNDSAFQIVTQNGTQTGDVTFTVDSMRSAYAVTFTITNGEGSDTVSALYSVLNLPAFSETPITEFMYLGDTSTMTLNFTGTNEVSVSSNETDATATVDNSTDTVGVSFTPTREGIYHTEFTITNGDGSDTIQKVYSVLGPPVLDDTLLDTTVYKGHTYTFTLNFTAVNGTVITSNSDYVTIDADNNTQTALVTYIPQESIYEGITFTASNEAGSDTVSATYRVLLLGKGGSSSVSSTPTEEPVVEPTNTSVEPISTESKAPLLNRIVDYITNNVIRAVNWVFNSISGLLTRG